MKINRFKVQLLRQGRHVRWFVMDRLSNGVLERGEARTKEAAYAEAKAVQPALALRYPAFSK